MNSNDPCRGLGRDRRAIGRAMYGIGSRTLRPRIIILACVAFAACDDHDIGQPCPQLLGDDESTIEEHASQSYSEEVIEQNPLFPCDEMVCVASAGRSGYCTRKCRNNTGCPAGFDCRVVQEIGVFAGQGFCVWKACNNRSDCGDTERYCCVVVPEADPSREAKFCDVADGNTCE